MKSLFFSVFLLFGCSTTQTYDAHNDCEIVDVDGPTQVIVAYRIGGDWYFAEPSNTGTIDPPKNIRMPVGADLVLIAFDDGSGLQVRHANSFYEHGSARGYCVK